MIIDSDTNIKKWDLAQNFRTKDDVENNNSFRKVQVVNWVKL